MATSRNNELGLCERCAFPSDDPIHNMTLAPTFRPHIFVESLEAEIEAAMKATPRWCETAGLVDIDDAVAVAIRFIREGQNQ